MENASDGRERERASVCARGRMRMRGGSNKSVARMHASEEGEEAVEIDA